MGRATSFPANAARAFSPLHHHHTPPPHSPDPCPRPCTQVPRGAVRDAQYYDTAPRNSKHFVRLAPVPGASGPGSGKQLLLVQGESHLQGFDQRK